MFLGFKKLLLLMSRIGIYPGTFDPLTFGHLNLIKRSLKIVDHLIIGVANNNNKIPLLKISERKLIIKNDLMNTFDNIKNTNLEIFNYGIGDKEGVFDFNQSIETQSSTLVSINYNSKYYKKKTKILKFFNKKNSFFSPVKVEIKPLSNFLDKRKVKYVEILKIDTEGYDFNVIKSLGSNIKDVKYIYFEHHFHDMLKKNYNLTQLHTFLIKNGFKKAFKTKMFYRKTFEYIYKNINI